MLTTARLRRAGWLAMLLLTSGAAFLSILRRRIDVHRAWMVRSCALVFAAVTFRSRLGLAATGLPFDQVYDR